MEDGKPNSHPPMVGGEDEMDVGDCSEEGEEEDEEEEEIEMGSSPLEDHGSLMMALASSNVLPYEGLASPLRLATSGGKPLGLRRGPGRPPRRGTPPHSTRLKKPLGLKLKRWKGSVYMPSDKSPRHSMDGDTMDGERGVDVSPAHSSEPNTPALSSDDKHDKFAPPSYTSDEPPYFQETWPGKVCALCNLSERTQLGQGEMIKVTCPDGFTPQKKDVHPDIMSPPNDPDDSSLGADKSPRCSTTPALSYRRQKSWSKCRNPSINGQEPLDELAIIGYTEEPDVTNLFEHSNDQWVVYVHESCALWSLGISRPSDSGFQAIGPIVINASVKKCASCSKMGASTACTFSGCTKYFHLPCAAAVGCFQDAKTYALVCNIHLHHVPLMANLRDVTCMSCYSLGDVSNLVMCCMCGNNYHGSCVGLALLPGSRAGWQCSDCRMCQVCRQPEDSKIMVCETCDKAYHPHCLRPIVTTIPKYGWKCKCCRLCSDCGSRTPGAGQSSRWHAHYTVCDSCYQQRNKGFSCPLCRRAYRAAAYREMVQCSKCKKFVHGTCDSEADLATYQLKKETTPEYEYVCPNCKSGIQNALKRKDSTEDFCMDSNMSASQESLLLDEFDFDCDKDGYSIGVGLGKGKPFSASKIAKKKLGLGSGLPGRPGKGLGKVSGISLSVMSSYQKKHQRCNEFGRKRIPKAKMRGIFGVPGLGLQRPQADTTQSKSDEEPGGENRLVLCSAKDKFVLTQDMCVMCGALGTDQEGCLIACAQCGQCYHPYCVSVKVTKVILQKGWRCLDCTVCEGCGQKNDEARLILCDDCDISYHIYCMDPPLSYVPRGTWKCKWCAQCLTCGANNPGFNCTWLRNYTECGPCASRISCPSCAQGYGDGELIIKCIQCERWLHCACDQIRDENEAEFCAEEGYSCILCRPRDVKPPHLLPGVFQSKPRPPSPARSPDYTKVMDKDDFYVVDGVKLSESGLHQIRALTIEQQVQPRKKRSGPRRHGFPDRELFARPPTFTDKEAGILAAIESVVAGGRDEDADEDSIIKEEVSRYKEGMEVTPRPDGRAPEPPEGFSIYTTESGVMVLRRKRQRNLQRLGIGGFNARLRQTRCRDKEEESGAGEGAPATTPTTPGGSDSATTPTTPAAPITGGPEDKPRRKPQRRKPKSKLVENYPSYLQEAFFGRDLLDTSKETSQDLPSSSDESEEGTSRVSQDKTITLSQDELKVIEQMKIKQEKECDQKKSEEAAAEESGKSPIKQEEDDGSDSEALKDILRLPDNLLDTELVNTIMTEGDGDIKSEDALMADTSLADDSELNRSSSTPPKDELSDILGPHFNLESMVRETGLPNMDCKDVEEIFKGVLTDESQESQESPGVFPMTTGGVSGGVHGQSGPPIMSPSHSVIQAGLGLSRQPGSNLPSVVHSNLPSPITFPAASPYHSEYSNSPQFSPAFSEPPSPWADDGEGNGPHSQYNQRNTLKMEADETLANNATISCVLYANMNHPEWKKEYPTWSERSKQILKKWRALPSEKKAPYLQQARDNRANLRMKKAQQEQDKLQQQQKNCREAEQERAWKQMQALRQQQAAQQQQVMQDQRAQAARSVHRQLSVDGGVLQMGSEQQSHLTSQLQVSTVQDTGSLPSMTSPGGVRTPQQFPSPVGIKAQHIGSPVGMTNYPRTGTPALPIRGVVNPPTSQDPFAPPRQMQPIQHPAGVQGQEMNRQLRDLLQRQHIKNKMESEQMIQQRVWPLQEDQGLGTSTADASGGLSLLPPAVSQAQNTINFEPNNAVNVATNSPTFRHPLPPSLARPTRLPLQQGQMIIRGQRMAPFSDPRMQTVDPRVRLLLQQQHQQQQRPGFSPSNQMVARLAGPRNSLDPYDHLVQQRPEFQEGPGGNIVRQIPSNLCSDPSRIQSGVQNSPLDQQRIAVTSGGDSREEIPESVTAELEKLEQEEGSTIPEVENVGAILGDLVEDDDELLAEMGADFNILEYADPELDTVTGGEKTNILDVDLEEEDTKKDNASINNRSEKKEDVTPGQDSTKTTPVDNATNNGSIDKPLSNVPQETTTSSSNQNSLPLMTMSSSNNVAPPMSQPQSSIVGTVMTQSSGGIVATVSYPATFPVANQPLPRIQHIGQVAVQQQQRLQQLQRLSGGSRVVSVGPGGQILPPQQGQQPGQQGLVNSSPGLIPTANNLMSPTGTARLAPPPPPYPGPPPPYPGPIQQEGYPGLTPSLRRPLLLQEQPLLLEDLLEQEKREQEKQASVEPTPATALLSDADFERLRADVLGTPQGGVVASPPHGLPAQGILPAPGLVGQSPALRPQFVPRPQTQQSQWQQSQPNIVRTPVLQQETTLRVPLFNAPVLPPPTPPPDNITTEQDKQQQLHYETWLNNQNHIVTQQLKYYETEVQKLRKIRKSLNSRQRQLRKNGNELAENDAMELQRVTAEQAVLQKQLESSRKQSRQHGVLIQEYRNKQQANKVVRPGGLSTSLHSSPSGSSPQSPLLTSPSPGPLSVSQQQSPRIGTPHSQGDDNPFSPGTPGTSDILRSLPSPGRLTSPSPRAITSPRAPNPPPPSSTPRPNVGSPGAFSVQDQSIRPLGMPPRFVRSPESGGLRPRAVGLPLQVPGPTASPVVYQGPRNVAFNSNPQPIMTAINDNKMVRLGGLTPQQQQMLLRQQLHQQRQVLLQQQQELTQEAGGLRQIAQQRLEQQQQQQGEGPTPQQRQIQLVHQKQALLQQQELLQQQLSEPNLNPQQRQQIMQQRQALIHQSTEIAVQEKAIRLLLQNQEGLEGGNINRQQFQMLQHRQQQLAQQTRQQLILSQQGKTGQFRQMIQQQQQGPQQQSPSRSPMGQFGQTSPMPSPIVQHFSGTPTSPMPPQSPIQQQFPGNSPMHPQSPMVNQTQSSSPILPQSPIGVQQQFNQPNNSPMHPQSPMIQYSNQTPNSPMPPHSPRVQQQFSNQTPNSPLTPQSPMVQNQNYQHQVTTPPMQSYNQPPSSPMQSPRMQPQYGQPPSSPLTPQSPLVQQNQFVHRPNSPMPPKSPMPPMGSPMPMRRPSSTGGSIASSPQIPDRPQSVENPATPRTPQDYEGGGGGGNPHNPLNPIPLPPGFGRFGYIKLGLRGGSPMWGSDRIPPRKPTIPKVSRDGSGSSKSETPMAGISSLKTGSLVSLDYNEFEDDSSRNSAVTPPAKMLQKKQQIIETQEQSSKPSDRSEFTVYDDIVLVESCKGETNLEVEELQSSLQSNVMSMPMVLDSVPIPIINLGSGNVEGQLLEECLVSGTDLVVLDVSEQSESEGCLLDMVEKDHMDSGGQDLSNLEDELTERESKGDESDVIELMEESSSPPSGRKRMVGKVLPGETLRKVQEKRDSTTDTPDSPYQDDTHADPSSETDNETISTTFENIEKSDAVSTTTPEGVQTKEETKTKIEETKINFPVISGVPPSSMHQANIGIPGLSRQTMSYPTFPRNPSFPRHVLPIIKSDGRPVFTVQATVANLVQDAVNAAKLAAEKKSLNQGVSLSSGVVIPNILSTPSTIASLGVVSTTCSTLIGPPRMSVPFSSGGRVTVTNAPTGTHYVPILSQSDKLSGLLKIESLKVINKKIDLSDKSGDKTVEKQMPKITSAMLITSHPSSESASTSDLIFQRRYFEDKFKSDIKLTTTKSEDNRLTPQIPTPTKFHNYSKMLVKSSNERQASPSRSHSLDMDSESRRSDIIQRSDIPENLSTQNSIIMKHFSNESVRHAGVICNKRSSIDLTSSTSSSSNTSSVITQVSVISDNKTTSSVHDNLFKSENIPSEESGSISSSILEAQLTAACNKEDLLPRNSSAASPSKTLFSFLDNVGPPNKDSKPQPNKEPQSVSVNMSKILLPFDEQTIHTEGMTLYRSSENITATSNMPHVFKSTQSISEIKLPTSVSEFKNIQEESRVISQPSIFSQAVRRIGNIYVHSQNIKSESNLPQSESQKGKDDTSEQKPTQRNISVLYSTEQPFQNLSKDTETVVTKTDLSRTSSMTDLLRAGQKRESVFERQISTESREVEKINMERQICSSKSMPSRLGELISGSASVQAHIERRISIAGQTDLMANRSRFFQKEEPQNTENLQQRTVSSSESSTSVVFSSGSVQRENITETNTTPSQFIPLSSMLTPKTEPEEKLIRISSLSVPRISEESQNVLLKQLLQNTACATTAVTATTPVNTLTIPPPLPVVDGQRPAAATTTTVVTQTVETANKVVQSPVTTQMSSVPVPKVSTPPTPQNIVATATIKTPQESPQPEVRRMSTGTPTSAGTPTSTLDELLSPTSSCSMPQTSPVVIKREPMLMPSQIKREPMPHQTSSAQPMVMTSPVTQKSPVMVEVKKEIISSDEMISPSLRHQESTDAHISGGSLEQNLNMPLDPQDIKKIKRRQYQQKRRQSQGKDAIGGTPKKRPRKNSKVEEDYDSFIDALMVQLRQTPAMSILEPSLSRNYTVCPIFGSGDLSKVSCNTRLGDLKGTYGSATLSTESDYYNTQPYGDLLPVPPQSTPSTQRGFYNEEFAPLKLDTFKDELDERKLEFNRDRDNDTPDTIVSSSSPECIVPEIPIKYPGLRLIEDDDSDEDTILRKRGSPVVPLFAPQAVKPKTSRFLSEMDKENQYGEHALIKTRISPSIPLKDSGNVTVTLTLTSAAADDVLGVLRNLANVLRIPAPTAFHITERTATPPSHKLGLYRCKGKDGKEGAPIDIQSILNGAAKFCRHCDVVILNNLIKKKATEMPFLAREEGSEDLYFCSSACYMQLALLHHPPSISKDKAAAIVDHLSQNDPSPPKKTRLSSASDTAGEIKKSVKLDLKPENFVSLKMDVDEGKSSAIVSSEKDLVRKEDLVEEKKPKVKGIKYRVFNGNAVPPPASKHKKASDKEMTDMLFRMGITVTPQKMPDDTRVCLFCHQTGDGVADGPARLLNYDVDKWVHLNCALWSDEVYETVNGALMNVETALQQSFTAGCTLCHRTGATLKCYKMRCLAVYHLSCAVKDECIFYKNKTLYCNLHVPKNEKDNELTTLSVFRRVYVNRDENRQVASVMHHTEHNHLLRVGTLIFLNVGQLLPHQLAAFHTPNYIYPIGYKIIRFYWSMRVCNKRCRYVCSIHEANGRPEFRVLVQEPAQDDIELRDLSPRAVWTRILEPLSALRKSNDNVLVFPRFVSGEDLFGLTEPAIVKVLESLPGVETLTDYRFKYGRNPLLELPLAINPSGCARCEGKPRGQGHWKRAHTQRTGSASRPNFTPSVGFAGDAVCPYSKQFVHSKSSQYKKMKQEWRNNVYLARSKIQGLGLYAARDLEKHTMVIEYIGEIIRTELAESREKQYEAKNRGIYMFRLDEERVVDATLSGGLARYINHSCNPNCVAETVEVERDQRIIIFAKRRISRGEELAYDYKFDIEDDQHKIPCMCGAPNCRKWMN